MERHTLSLLVENKPGVLARIAGLFSARGYNIVSLVVAETENSTISRMTIVVEVPEARILEQIIKQLRRLINTISVVDLTNLDFLERELALVKIKCDGDIRQTLLPVLIQYSAEIIKYEDGQAIVEICADPKKVKGFLDELKPFGIVELMRTNKVAMLWSLKKSSRANLDVALQKIASKIVSAV